MLARSQNRVGHCFMYQYLRGLHRHISPPYKTPGTRHIHSYNQRTYAASTLKTPRPLSAPSTMFNTLPNQEQHWVKSTTPGEPTIHALFEPATSTWQYIVADPTSFDAVIIDPVLDYDRATQTIATHSADGILQTVNEHGYDIAMILETHIHADHMTAASYLQGQLSRAQGSTPPIGIGKRIEQVQKLFGGRYGVSESEYKGVFGKYFDDGEHFTIGALGASVLHLPGHTPDHVGYQIGDNVFCGDSVFHADIGTARCDFPGGSARDMFNSGRRLLGLEDEVKIWTGHDYPPQDRRPSPYMSVRQHRQHNKHLMDGATLEHYVKMRGERDASMSEPKLLHPSLQMNIRAGRLPEPASSGYRLLHLPLKWEDVL
ncbi:beta-lactamase-like protein [Aspergillus aurantiobrunneus]